VLGPYPHAGELTMAKDAGELIWEIENVLLDARMNAIGKLERVAEILEGWKEGSKDKD